MRNVYLVISEGNVYRDLVRLGMLSHLLESASDIRVILLTQAWAVPEVRDEVAHDRVIIARHDRYEPRRWLGHLMNFRARRVSYALRAMLMRLEVAGTPTASGLEELGAKYPPNLIVTSHPQQHWDWDVVVWARRHGIPTLGIVKSWDNLFSRIPTRPNRIAVWGRANAQDAVELAYFKPCDVTMVGAAAFDRYFTRGVLVPRDEFWRRKGLDPSKPILLFGTAGSFSYDWDETFMMDLLLELRRQNDDFRQIQIVCRLHPCSRLEYFWPYRDAPGVILSFGSYVKTYGWCMTRDEVDEMTNMLAHADLVITPASTLSVEAPIFDTPTLVTFFSTVRPDLHAKASRSGWLNRHFKRVQKNDWLPLAFSPEDLALMMKRALSDRAWYREGRNQLVDEVVTFKDGKAFERVAAFIDQECPTRPAQ